MKIYKTELEENLNTLLSKNRDAQEGFMKIAKSIEDTNFKVYLTEKSIQRELFAKEIKEELKKHDMNIFDWTSLPGDIHHLWIDLRNLVGLTEKEDLLQEIIRGEESALNDYKNILEKDNLPSRIKVVLRNHANAIESSILTTELIETTV